MSEAAAGNGPADLEKAARRAVELALAAGPEQADAFCEETRRLTVRAYEGTAEHLTDAGGRGRGVRAFVEGRAGYAYGSDLREAGLAGVARFATDAAGVTEPDEHVGLPEDCGAADVPQLSAPDVASWSGERKVKLALELERAA